jgi:AraC-like DNA-binding protein
MTEIASGAIASTSSLMTGRLSGLFETVREICPGNGILDGEALWAHIQETASSRYPGQLATILVDSLEILERVRRALVDSLEILETVLQPLAGNRSSNGPATSVQHTDSKAAFLPSNRPRWALRTAPALTYIHEHYATKLTLREVAVACNMRPRQFSGTFKKEHRMPFKGFLINYRLDRSRDLLKQGSSVKVAASLSGFTDMSYFSRVFRLRYTMTPTSFKETHVMGPS